jgi:hypothetical protein
MRPTLLLALCLPLLANAEGMSPQDIAKVQHEEKKALDRVAKDFGNKKPSEMSSSERREMIRAQQAAVEQVHSQLGVDAKDYARTSARLDPEERKEVVEATKALEEKEKEQKKKKEAPAAAAEGVEVYEGLDEGQLEQLDEPTPAEGEVQIMLPGQKSEEPAEPEAEPTE